MRMKMGIRMRWSMRMTTTATTMVKAITTTKSSMRETPNLSTDADRSINLKKKINPERLLVFKALQVGPQMHAPVTRHCDWAD